MTLANPFVDPIFQVFVPAQNGIGLVPAAGYKAKFYEAGTDTAQEVYTDPELTTPYPSPSNIVTLDLNGQASENGLIYLKTAGYKMVITDPNDAPIENGTVDKIPGNGAVGSFNCGFVATFADLVALNASIFSYAMIAGYSAAGDGGQGFFYLQTSGASADGGYIQNSTDGSKKWFRVPDEDGDVRAASFGYIGGSGTIQTTQLQTADSYAASIGARLRIGTGQDAFLATVMNFTAPYVKLAPNGAFKGTVLNPVAISFQGLFEGPDNTVFPDGHNILSVSFSPYQISNPYWFGASPANDAATNDTAFASWVTAGGGAFTILPGTWLCTSALTLLGTFGNLPVNLLGVLVGDDDTFGPGFWYPETFRFQTFLSTNSRYIGPYGPNAMQTDMDWLVGRDLQAIRDALVGRDITVTRTIIGNENESLAGDLSAANVHALTGESTAGTNIRAGMSGGGGYLEAQAGTGSATFKAAGRIITVVGAGNGTLLSNTLINTNDAIRIVAQGTFTGVSDDTITVAIGSATLDLTAKNTNGTKYRVEVDIFKTASSNTLFMIGTLYVNGETVSSTHNVLGQNSGTDTVTLSSNQTISVTSSNTLTQQFLIADYFPA